MVRTFIVCEEIYLQPVAGALGGGMLGLHPNEIVREDEYPLSKVVPTELGRLIAKGKLEEVKS